MGALCSLIVCAFLAGAVSACEPRKPGEPKPPLPKVDFTHERSTS